MERNEQRNYEAQPVDFVDFISQDLPWDELALPLSDKSDQLTPTVTDSDTCLQTEHEFNPDDLSLFSAFANSLPSLAQQTDSAADFKGNTSLTALVEEDVDTGTDLAKDIETDLLEEDLDCPDEISLSSQMEYIMADILDSTIAAHCDEKHTNDDKNETGNCSVLQMDNNVDADDVGQTESVCNVMLSDERCGVGETTDDVAECRYSTNGNNLSHCGEIVSDSSLVTEQTGADDKCACETECTESLDREQCTVSDSAYLSDEENMTSQEWLYDNLHGHLMQQHNEATKVNSLRFRLPPPPGIPSIPMDRISRATHAFTTEVKLVKLDIELINCLIADSADISRCCKLLDDYSPYELSPGVLVQYPFFAGTVDVCCRWIGDKADELHSAAHRLRAFMMAMYARHSVDEGFLTALNRQVAAYRHAMAANMTRLTKLMSKHCELSHLSDFYKCLYSHWDTFMSQFYDPKDQFLGLETRSQNNEVTPGLDVAAKRWRKCDVGRRDDSNVDEHVTGTVQRSSRGRSSQSELDTKNDVEVGSQIVRARFDEKDVEPDLSSDEGVPLKRRHRRMRSDDSSEHDNITAQVCTVQKSNRKHRKPKESGPGATRKNHSEIVAEMMCTRFAEQDVKPDLTSVDVNVASFMTVKRRSDRLRQLAASSEDNSIRPDIGTLEKNRNAEQSNQSAKNTKTGRRNGVEVVGEIVCPKSEEEDVKPDLTSLAAAAVRKKRRRRSKPLWTRRRKQSDKNRNTSRKNGVEVDGLMIRAKFEEQDVKPDLRSLAAAAVRKRRRRSERIWAGSPGVITRSRYRIKLRQQLLSTANMNPAASHVSPPLVSPARSTRSPPFKLLSPSQIKVEANSQ